ncbi:MAG: ABC transporter substrate-binding protein [Proteobacteria bacterium]|nr:ABC transporter substrate-binding protein [Pseudomonadota bacterium]
MTIAKHPVTAKPLSRRRILLAAGAAGATMLASPALRAQAKLPIRITLNAPRDGSNAAFFLAAAKGYFAEAGVEATLDPSRGAGDSIQRVASETYDFGFSDFTVLVQFAARNPELAPIAVAALYTRSPISIISLAKTGIAKPKDLEGKRLGAPPTDAGFLLLPAFVQATGIDRSKIQIDAIDLTLREAALAQGRVDAVTGFDSTTLFNLMRVGIKKEDVKFLYFSDYDLDFYSNGLIVSRKFIKENEKLIPGIVGAFIKAWRETIANPAATVEALGSADGLVDKPLEVERLKWLLDHQIVTEQSKKLGIGMLDTARFARGIDQVATAMELPRKPAVSELWTDKYLPPMAARTI